MSLAAFSARYIKMLNDMSSDIRAAPSVKTQPLIGASSKPRCHLQTEPVEVRWKETTVGPETWSWHIIANSFPSVSTSVPQSARDVPSGANRFHSKSVFVFPRDVPQKQLWSVPEEPLCSAWDTRQVCFTSITHQSTQNRRLISITGK